MKSYYDQNGLYAMPRTIGWFGNIWACSRIHGPGCRPRDSRSEDLKRASHKAFWS